MAHEIENMMYVGETPWHGLGIKLDKPPTAEEAIIAAGLNWKVHLEDMQLARSHNEQIIPSHKAVVRASDSSILGVVGNKWNPIQNSDAFKFFDPFIQSGEAEYHTAGSLKDGKKIWILAKLGGGPLKIAKDDVIEKYLLLSNGHDGKNAGNIRFTPIRVVCNNTLTMAEGDDEAPFLRVLHRGDVVQKLEDIQKIISLTNQSFEATAEQYRALAKKGVKNLDRYILSVLKPRYSFDEFEDDELSTVLPRASEQIKELFETGRGQDNKAIRGTYWAAYNAVTEWVDYQRGGDNTRLEKAWFGKGHRIKQIALDSAFQFAS
jgi:phage/plasmid-like protein (TIGR03299 family)